MSMSSGRSLYDLDLWIRQSLLDTRCPEATMAMMAEALAENAVELGFIQHADGSWRWAGEWTWGPGVTIEQVREGAVLLAPEW